MKEQNEGQMQLPENAFRELSPGEEYTPIMKPEVSYPEVNAWSVTWGIVMAMLFSAAAAYLGLKVGQVFEAAIPIAIIAVGVSTATKRSKALGENVIIQSIGACSGAVVAGAIFTLPAIYILQAKYPNIRILNVTAGADGSYSFYGTDAPVFVPACTLGGVIETTGAGDTFCASVLNFVLEHDTENLTEADRTQMLRFANTAAYIVTTRKGAIRAMPEKAEVEQLLAK